MTTPFRLEILRQVRDTGQAFALHTTRKNMISRRRRVLANMRSDGLIVNGHYRLELTEAGAAELWKAERAELLQRERPECSRLA